MGREGYQWSEDRGRWESERDREVQDREHERDRYRDRYRDRDRDAYNAQRAGRQHEDRGDRFETRDRNDGAWDEGQADARSYGQGMYGGAPGTQGQQGYRDRPGPQRGVMSRGEAGQPGWGSYSRGNDLGRAANRYGNTGGDQYGGGGFRGGEGYGARGADSGNAYDSGMPSYGGGIGSWFGSGGGFADVGVNGGFGNSMGSGYGGGSNTAPGSAMASGRGWGDRGNMSGYAGSVGTPSMPWSHDDQSRTAAPQTNHAGRGPKGWKRSDDRIRDDISEQLERHPGIDASDIEVQVQEGEVTLSGTVTDRHTKRMAEDVAERISGVHEVQNQIRVQRENATKP